MAVWGRGPLRSSLLLLVFIFLQNSCDSLLAPRFTKIPTDQIGVSGGVVSFVCQAAGDPKPQVFWNKKGKKVNSQRIETVEFDEGAGAVLRIQPLRAPRDENVYECVAKNTEGEVAVTSKLSIIREDLLPFGFPSIDMGPQLKVVERTRTATMLCAASGIPDPEISWFKDFLPVEPALSQGRIKQLRSGVFGALQIERSEETDQGKYECVASNSQGVRYSSPANLYVRELREVRRVPPRFTIPPVSHEIMPGGSVNITCVAVGSPMPYVKWMLNSEDLTPEEEMPVGRNVLELNGVRESANYTCVAMSSLGIIESVAQVIVKSLPRAPGTPVVTETTPTSITITWDSGNPDPVSYYIIQYRAKSPDSKYETVDSITTTRYSIGGLYPNTEYEIRVSAVNTIGQGTPSNKVEARTGEQAPASPPRNIQARILSQNAVMVRWDEPEEPNGLIKGYRVYYTMDPSQPMSNWQIHNVQDSMITAIHSLVPSETYTIRVLAFTSVGDGPFSDPVHVKVRPGVPGQPGKFQVGKVTDTNVELTWVPAYSKEPVKAYELIYKAPELGIQEKRNFEPRTSYVVEGLRANTEYTFSLAAVSNKGIGAFTNEINQRTAQAKPSVPPRDLRCSAAGSTSLSVSWAPAVEEPLGYEVRYGSGGESPQTLRLEPGTGRALLTGLRRWSRYRVTVAAITAQGGGPESAAVECRTDEDVPRAPPRQVEVQPINSTSVKVSWRTVFPGQRNGQIRGYQVHYARMEHGESLGLPRIKDMMLDDEQRDTDETAQYELMLEDLQPETLYSISVGAYTIKGDGAQSVTHLVQTPVALPARPVLSVQLVNETSAALIWTHQQSSNPLLEILGFHLTYDLKNNSQSVSLDFRPEERQHNVTGLRPGGVYSFLLAARGRSGYSEEAQEQLSVPEFPPKGFPQLSEHVNATCCSLQLTWLPPSGSERNAGFTGYTLTYEEAGGGVEPHTLMVPADLSSYTIHGLNPDWAYAVRISAHNRAGSGPYSPQVLYRTTAFDTDVPRNFSVNLATKTSVLLTWEFPESSAPYRFTVEYNRQKMEVDARLRKAVIPNLQPDTSYDFKITSPEGNMGGLRHRIHAKTSPPILIRRPEVDHTRETEATVTIILPSLDTRSSVRNIYVVVVPLKRARGVIRHLKSPDEMDLEEVEQEGTVSGQCDGCVLYAQSLRVCVSLCPLVPARPVLSVQLVNETSAALIWTHQQSSNPLLEILGFHLTYDLKNNSQSVSLDFRPEERQHNVTGLRPGGVYSFLLAARGRSGYSEEAQEQLSVPEFPPKGFPQLSEHVNATCCSLQLTWLPPSGSERNAGFTGYTLTYEEAGGGVEPHTLMVPADLSSYTIHGLNPDWAYAVRISAHNRAGSGPYSPQVLYRTTAFDTDVPRNFSVNLATKTSVLLTWEFPESSAPYRFTVEYNRQKMEVDARLRKAVIPNLQPDTSYDFKITSPEGNMGGLRHRIHAKTSPPILIRRPEVDHTRETEAMVTIILPSLDTRSSVRNIYVVVVPLKRARGVIRHLKSPDEMDLEELLKDISQKQRDPRQRQVDLRRAYITARFTPATLPAFFTLGDQLDYGGFENRALEPGQEYVFFILAELNSTTGVRCVCFLLVLCVFSLISKRKDSEPGTKCLLNNAEMMAHNPTDPVEMRRINFQTPGMMSHPPIPISELPEHTDHLKANDNLHLSQEYESIDPGQQFTWEHSNLEVNKPKNRYANVIAYDHTRVILAPTDGIMGSDYINANYIDGFRKQNAYIATQGPLPETFGDFWRMVWEQRAASVVMMTKLEEKSRIKCDQYWPSRGTDTFGGVQVALLDTMELATFCVRTFSLHKSGCNERREVRQFQFTAWPDHGVPEYPTPFLAFLRRVKACNPPDAGPVIVHCSAGVGRTGCFIVIDAMLERIRHERTVDVYGHVTLMRSQRNYMVQTEDQYGFIHEALLEAVACGNTEVAARSLCSYIQNLSQVEAGEHVTGIELEFKCVSRQQRAYIATQGPLAETTEDFWRTLWEHNSTIVVMLTKLREMGREKCHQYWPAERSARYQYFVVDPMAEYNMPQYILREFKVTDARDGQSRTVRQFQFTDWPEQGVPKSGEGFIDFIGQVHKTKEQFGQDGPIAVHCSAGVGRTGVFITLSIVLERMRYEGAVDIFQTVKMLRTQRPAMVQTEDEYQFSYQAALEYLGSFDHYAT
ncbi:receptor-type tyrosine-protein phosphatase S-like [Sinocyclocheilus grahami]|uniref:receptor-type tyrosine-protein phosphatase S-like n=1 Tax=Sinocyclocheilus grahami TaxID=75366 RepID=UPI0007AD30F0|nr:PREDICTED: receptor-type tyrosine-protein phosphatase S-like [Sinocyclocheilus grahami]